MPFITVRTMTDALSNEKKKLLHKKLADLFVEIEGNGNEEFRKYITVLIEEEDAKNWSLGGTQATTDFVKKMTL